MSVLLQRHALRWGDREIALALEDDEIVVGHEILGYWTAGASGTTRTGRRR